MSTTARMTVGYMLYMPSFIVVYHTANHGNHLAPVIAGLLFAVGDIVRIHYKLYAE